MLDSDYRSTAALQLPSARPIEFCTIELSPLADGHFAVAVRHTVFDNTALELVDRDIASARVITLDEVMVLVADSLRITFSPLSSALPHLS